MKKTINSNSNLLLKLKNFWFGAQLIIVSISLPVLCIVEVSHSTTDTTTKQEEVIKNSVNQNEVIGLQSAGKTVKFS